MKVTKKTTKKLIGFGNILEIPALAQDEEKGYCMVIYDADSEKPVRILLLDSYEMLSCSFESVVELTNAINDGTFYKIEKHYQSTKTELILLVE